MPRRWLTVVRTLACIVALSSLPTYMWYNRTRKEHIPFRSQEETFSLAIFQIAHTVHEVNWRNLPPQDPANPRAEFELIVALSVNLPKLTKIPRMTTPPPYYFRDYIASSGLPVVFTDMLKGTAFEQWSWDYLKRRFGHIVFNNTRQGDYLPASNRLGKQEIHRVSVQLSDFIDVVNGMRKPTTGEEGLYITKQHFLPRETLLKEFVWPPFYNNKGLKCYMEPSAWIGNAGTFTQGHFDSKDNFAYQIIGRKRWTIYPPSDYDKLYFTKAEGRLEWSAALNIKSKPDLVKYPLLADTKPLEFTLSEGEVLYLPRGWTHVVENLTPAVMINVWRKGPAAIAARFITKNSNEIDRLCMK